MLKRAQKRCKATLIEHQLIADKSFCRARSGSIRGNCSQGFYCLADNLCESWLLVVARNLLGGAHNWAARALRISIVLFSSGKGAKC